MSLLFGFLTFILVVNCLFLILLVLVQLPKKEAGAGLAFGAGAVDTLIGAGSGNALTKLTKYSATSFLGLAVVLAVLNSQRHESSTRLLQQELAKKSAAAPVIPQTPQAPATGLLPGNAVTAVTNPAAEAASPAPLLQLTPQAEAPAAAVPQPQ